MNLVAFRFAVRSYLRFDDNVPLTKIITPERAFFLGCKSVPSSEAVSFFGADFGWTTETASMQDVSIEAGPGRSFVGRSVFSVPGHVYAGGYIDHRTCTQIDITFEIEDLAILDEAERLESLWRWVWDVFVRFYNSYRIETMQWDIADLIDSVSPIIYICIAKSGEYVIDDKRISAKFSVFKENAGLYAVMFRQDLAKPQVDKDTRRRIVSRMTGKIDLTLSQEIFADAIETGGVKERFDLSVVLVGTAFEVELQRILSEACQARGIAELPDSRGNLSPYRTAIEEGNVQAQLLRYYAQIVGTSFDELKMIDEYKNWKADAYSLRNEIIHRGRRAITPDQLSRAIHSIRVFMTYLYEKLQLVRPAGG